MCVWSWSEYQHALAFRLHYVRSPGKQRLLALIITDTPTHTYARTHTHTHTHTHTYPSLSLVLSLLLYLSHSDTLSLYLSFLVTHSLHHAWWRWLALRLFPSSHVVPDLFNTSYLTLPWHSARPHLQHSVTPSFIREADSSPFDEICIQMYFKFVFSCGFCRSALK